MTFYQLFTSAGLWSEPLLLFSLAGLSIIILLDQIQDIWAECLGW